VLPAELLHDALDHTAAAEAWRELVPRPFFGALDTARRAVEEELLHAAAATAAPGQGDLGAGRRTSFPARAAAVIGALRAARSMYESDRAPFFGANARAHGDTVTRAKLLRDAAAIRKLVDTGVIDAVGDGGAWIGQVLGYEAVADTLGDEERVTIDSLDPDTQLKPIENSYNRAVYMPPPGEGDPGAPWATATAPMGALDVITAELAAVLVRSVAASHARASVQVSRGSGGGALTDRTASELRAFLAHATIWNTPLENGAGFRATLTDGFFPDVLGAIAAAILDRVARAGIDNEETVGLVDAWAESYTGGGGGETTINSTGDDGCSCTRCCAGVTVDFYVVLALGGTGTINTLAIPRDGAAVVPAAGSAAAIVKVEATATVVVLAFGRARRMSDLFPRSGGSSADPAPPSAGAEVHSEL
jgi:hypothetical protein